GLPVGARRRTAQRANRGLIRGVSMKPIGVVDSGAPLLQAPWLVEQRRFVMCHGKVVNEAVVEDVLGHGSAVLQTIQYHCPQARFVNAQVLDGQGRCQVEQLAAALEWMLALGVEHVHLSVGLRRNDDALRALCQRFFDENKILVASCPAMGEAVFPANYPGVFSATGDARCAIGEWSWFQGYHLAEYGAQVRAVDGRLGSSMAAAHLSGVIAAAVKQQGVRGREAVESYLQANAH